MNHSFDELAKSLALGIPRREALWRLGGVMAGGALAALGLGSRARADNRHRCQSFCAQFPPGNQRRRCQAVCAQCADMSMLCGTSGLNVVCCQGGCCTGHCTNTSSDPSNCGSCGTQCPAGNLCCIGTCVNPQTNASNCGSCGSVCGPVANASAVGCANGNCVVVGCNAGFADCNGMYNDGCETNVSTDVNNCGNCGNVCGPVSNANAVGCANGNCVILGCNAGFADCNGMYNDGCETNLATDPNNCGTCGHACGGAQTCSSGVCVCTDPTLTACGSGCFDLTVDPNHCGACGHRCQPGLRTGCCDTGVCGPCV